MEKEPAPRTSGSSVTGKRGFVLDAHSEVVAGLGTAHVFDDGDEVAGTHIAAAEAGGAAGEAGHAMEMGIAFGAGHGVGECRLDLAELRIGLHHGDIEALDDGDGLDVPQGADDFAATGTAGSR